MIKTYYRVDARIETDFYTLGATTDYKEAVQTVHDFLDKNVKS